MQVKNYSDFRKNLANTMNMVTDNRMPVVITRAKKEPVVMISLADFNSYEETAYLLKTKKNRERLLSSVKNIKEGNYKKQKLSEI
jgi:antitoxin YefM